MTIAELKSNIDSAVDNSTLKLTAALAGEGAVASFIDSLPTKLIQLGIKSITLTETSFPKMLIVVGDLKDTWTLQSFKNTALTKVTVTATFIQTTDADAIVSTLSCTASVAISGDINVDLKGGLTVDSKLLLVLDQQQSAVSKLKPITAFIGEDTVGNLIPDIDIFQDAAIKLFDLTYGFGSNVTAFTFNLDLGKTWNITDKINISGLGLTISAGFEPLEDKTIQRSYHAEVRGVLFIGQNYAIKIGVDSSNLWLLEVIPQSGNLLPGIEEICEITGTDGLYQTVQSGLQKIKVEEIAIDGVNILFDYNTKKVNNFLLKSHVVIAGVTVNVQTQLPDFQFSGNLAPGSVVNLKSIIAYYFPGAADTFPEIDITSFSVFAFPKQGTYSAAITIASDWQYNITGDKYFALEEVSAAIAYSPDGVGGSVSALLNIAGAELSLSSAYDKSTGWTFIGETLNTEAIAIGDLFKDLGNYFGIAVPNALAGTTISKIKLQFITGTPNFSFNLAGTIPFAAGNADIAFNLNIKKGDAGYSKLIDGKLTINENDFSFDLSADEASTTLELTYKGDITLADIATMFAFGNPVPKTLNAFKFTDLNIKVDTAAKTKHFNGSGLITINDNQQVSLDLSIDQKPYEVTFAGDFVYVFDPSDHTKDLTFHVDFEKVATGYDLNLALKFEVCKVTIVLAAGVSSKEEDGVKTTDKSFNGHSEGLNLKVTDMLTDLLAGIFDDFASVIPPEFIPDFTINDIYIDYTGNTGGLNLLASTTAAGKAVNFFFIYQPKQKDDAQSQSSYLFGIETDVASLGGLPLVGEQLKDVKFKDAGFVYTSKAADFGIPTLTVSADKTSKKITFAKARPYDKGFNLIGELDLGSLADPFPLILPMSSGKAALKGGNGTPSAPAKEIPSYLPGVKWININKGVGPVKLTRVGFAYSTDDSMLSLLLSAELAFSGIKFSVEGLGLAFLPAKLIKGENIEPEFRLSGLGLSINKGPLTISGMFVRVTPKAGEDIAFFGAAEISTAKFGISAIGAFSRGPKMTSFFIYGMYNGPIGGPSFFFVTGIAAGFGFNRSIRLPKIQQVQDFPLVAMALSGDSSKTINDVLSDLIAGDWIPSSDGDYWLAVGIKFTTFKIVDSFVLLTVEFGTRLQFAIMGLSLLKWPNVGTALVYVELAVMARFGTDSDYIAVEAMLTSNSYVFDKNCKLTGGFAFYTWISGPHEGDFVITLGGYHPRYSVPDYYPQVDRLGLNWKIGSIVTISGGLYYALTPNAIMAGGRWDVVCDLSFLKAAVTIFADVLIAWAPFYYTIDGGIIVRIEADIKILFVNIHFQLSMGAQVHIWGPPFAGEIYVDWSIFSFTIPFGATEKQLPPPLKWPEFTDKFVPTKDNQPHALDSRIAAGITDNIKDKDGNPDKIIIDPYNFVATVDSFFPVTEIYHADNQLDPAITRMDIAGQDMPGYLQDQNAALKTGFGIKPMGGDDTKTALNIQLERSNPAKNSPDVVTDNITFVATAKGMVSALWDGNADSNAVLKNVPAGVQMHTTEPVDGSIIEADLSIYETHAVNPVVAYGTNGDAYGRMEPKAIDALLSANINNTQRNAIVGSLNQLDFGLQLPDALTYDTYNIDIPLYVAAIGQHIPDIISA